MTNGEKMSQVMKEVFNVELSVYGDSVPKHCKFIKCPQNTYCEQCSKCEYKDFWEQEYKGV